MSDRIILAGDIGGTKTHLGLYRAGGGKLDPIADNRYRTRDYIGLADVCKEFLHGRSNLPSTACFGVPGPVVAGRSHATNVPWQMEEARLTQALGLSPHGVRLINDLEATAYGILHLEENETVVLQEGESTAGGLANIAVIAAGTGLGEAALVANNGRYFSLASEGGHCDFAPRGDEQIELLRFLAAEFGHVSWERVLSGPGLLNIYRFLKTRMSEPEPAWLKAEMEAEDPSAAISAGALERGEPRCVKALSLFVAIYGAEAGNLALKMLAFGGVYVGGGIAPKILPMLQQGDFVRAFNDKGRFHEALRRMQVRVVLNDSAALLGAAHVAAALG